MQPYFLPYQGYFKLVASVDKFVFYDDVNFIKNGWINRNRLLASGKAAYLTVPLAGAGSNTKICHVGVQDKARWKRRTLEMVRHSYTKAPNFTAVFDMFREIVDSEYDGIAGLARNSVMMVSRLLGLSTEFVVTSTGYKNDCLTGSDRVIDICRLENAKEYFNLPGGKSLYNPAQFDEYGIKLKFIDAVAAQYRQFDNVFVPHLSILDVLMFNSFDSIRASLIDDIHTTSA